MSVYVCLYAYVHRYSVSIYRIYICVFVYIYFIDDAILIVKHVNLIFQVFLFLYMDVYVYIYACVCLHI